MSGLGVPQCGRRRFCDACGLHPRMPPADFHALQGQADFLLDSMGWSGGVTAFGAFCAG
ncbi:MAG: hypothetical protein IPK97_16850 [Ahniella sp.]|nr:hypothetical protein [Ahniella sp.]